MRARPDAPVIIPPITETRTTTVEEPASTATCVRLEAGEPSKEAQALMAASAPSVAQKGSRAAQQFVLDLLSGKIGQGAFAKPAAQTEGSSEQFVLDVLNGKIGQGDLAKRAIESEMKALREDDRKLRAEYPTASEDRQAEITVRRMHASSRYEELKEQLAELTK